jgi:hypothetical protein
MSRYPVTYRYKHCQVWEFTEHLPIVTASNYSIIVNSQTLQFTTARTKCSQSALLSPVVVW